MIGCMDASSFMFVNFIFRQLDPVRELDKGFANRTGIFANCIVHRSEGTYTRALPHDKSIHMHSTTGRPLTDLILADT